jgi:uncharacterized protein DUF1707
MATGYNVRVGDADREAVAAQLREHYADGRLTLEELNERLDQAFAAKTRADLTTVLRDLPYVSRPFTGAPAGSAGYSAWPAASSASDWGHGAGYCRGRRSSAAALMMGLVWVFVILGAVMLFGVGGDRPLAIVLIIAAIAFLRRLFGFGGRRRASGAPRGPRGSRGPQWPRGPRL